MVLGAGLSVMQGCKDRSPSNAAPPSPAPDATPQQLVATARTGNSLPAGVVPVALARVDVASQRRVQSVTALVFVDLGGAVSLGRISQGATPYQMLPLGQDAALRAQLLASSVGVVPGSLALAFATFEADAAGFDTLLLADASVAATHVVDVLSQLQTKRTALAVALATAVGSSDGSAAPGALLCTFGPPAVTPLPMHIFVVLEDDAFTINVLDTQTPPTLRAAHQAKFDRAELIAALRVVTATVPAGRVHLDLATSTTMQRFVDTLSAIAATDAKGVEVASIDTSLSGPFTGGHTGHRGGHYYSGDSPTDYANLRPRIKVGNPTVKGPLDEAIVRRYMKRNFAKFQYCYEKQLLLHPASAGQISVTFTILAPGTVGAATATGFDKDVAACVVRAIESIQFPSLTQSPTVVTLPISFAPRA